MQLSLHYSKKIKRFNKKHCLIILRADKNALQQHYDSTITEVNQRLSDKAVLQINLNETRDTVRETNLHVS